MSNLTAARAFFEACETGQGWAACSDFCHPEASFSCQADALANTATIEDYAGWMAGLLGPIPDGHYLLQGFAEDAERGTVLAAAVFHGTQTGRGGPVPPTGKPVASDYVHVMQFEGDRIRHMTKIWNDAQALRALGWA